LEIDPGYLSAHTNLALLHEHLGETQQAILHWRKRHELGDPKDPWTARAEERLAALGGMASSTGKGPRSFRRREALEHEMEAHQESLDDFLAVTNRVFNQ